MGTFVYDDTEFTGCSSKDSRFNPARGWCSTTSKYEGKWRDCFECKGNELVAKDAVNHGAIRGLEAARRPTAALIAFVSTMGVLAAIAGVQRYRNSRISGSSP